MWHHWQRVCAVNCSPWTLVASSRFPECPFVPGRKDLRGERRAWRVAGSRGIDEGTMQAAQGTLCSVTNVPFWSQIAAGLVFDQLVWKMSRVTLIDPNEWLWTLQ